MLKWLATQYERRRGALQAKLEGRLRDKLATTPARQQSAELRRQGNECLAAGNLAEAEQFYRQGVAADPKDAACHSNLGYVLYEQGRRADAEESLERAVKLDQSDYDAYYLLGNIARDRQETLRAIVCYRTALRLKPDFDFCRRDLCVALAQSGRIEEAQSTMDEGPAFDESTAAFHFFRGNLHNAKEELPEARACLERAAELSPDDITVLFNACTVQLKLRDAFAALKTCQRMIEIDNRHASTYALLALVHQNLGNYDQSVANYRRALELDPNDLNAHRNFLFTLTYLHNLPPAEYLQEARHFGEKVRARARPYTSWHSSDVSKAPRPLRVGFVSGDLNFHPVGMFLLNVLCFLDKARISCIAYSNAVTEDDISAALRPHFAEWNAVSSFNDAALAQKIHDDHIDILVDLAGHTGISRISVFAWRPAPVQVAWLGYWASTGLSEMDYLLADQTSVHADEAAHYTERIWYLPDTRLCFVRPPADMQDWPVDPVPALANDYVTFGCFQNVTKLTDLTLAVWAEVLMHFPNARLRLQSHAFSHSDVVKNLQTRLAAVGIDLDRTALLPSSTWREYMADYRAVDIVLDTMPFPGGTTTAEALWMGVPTVTLAGNTLVQRQGASMLHCVGLDDWVAESADSYVRLAIQKASDVPGLACLRKELRARALASPLYDGPRFAKHLHTAFEGMYAEKLTAHQRTK